MGKGGPEGGGQRPAALPPWPNVLEVGEEALRAGAEAADEGAEVGLRAGEAPRREQLASGAGHRRLEKSSLAATSLSFLSGCLSTLPETTCDALPPKRATLQGDSR